MKNNQTKEQYKEWLNEIAKEKRNNPNHSEQAFIEILDYFDIKYTFEKPIIYNHKDGYNGYIFDFYILIDDNEFDIEIDGISHTDEDSKLKDQKRDALAKDCNIEVIRMDSYFVLYLRNIFEDEFTKESFLKWIINGCPISFKKDMSEYKEKYENAKKELDKIRTEWGNGINKLSKIYNSTAKRRDELMQTNKELQLENKKLNEQLNEMIQAYNEIQTSNEKIQALIKKREDDRQLAAENIMKEILAKQKNTSKTKDSSTSSNNSSTVETSNKQEDEELPF